MEFLRDEQGRIDRPGWPGSAPLLPLDLRNYVIEIEINAQAFMLLA